MKPDQGAGSDPRRFYDDLVEDYHLLFSDWRASVGRQAAVLDRLIATELGPPPRRILDCTCGIGTQAIGLALRGHAVHATDLSASAVRRARREAAALGATLTFGVADVRFLATEVKHRFDVVLACDNALPHLLTPDELRHGVGAMHARLDSGGLFLASIRDYDALLEQRPTGEPPRMFQRPEGRQFAVQVWDWDERAPIYTVHQFIVLEHGEAWETRHYQARYRAFRRAEFTAILHEVGFEDVRWRMPVESGYYQPIVTARR